MSILSWFDGGGDVVYFRNPPPNAISTDIQITPMIGTVGLSSINQSITNLQSTTAFNNLIFAVKQLGYDEIHIGYSSYIDGIGSVFDTKVLPDGSKNIFVQLDSLNRVEINGRIMSSEEIIFHEISHAIANDENYYDPEQAAVRFTNGLRSELGIPYRGDYHAGSLVKGIGLHPNLRIPDRCFTAGTPITLADGTEAAIESITPDTVVLAVNDAGSLGRGTLEPCRVVRTFKNITDEWVKISYTNSAGHAVSF